MGRDETEELLIISLIGLSAVYQWRRSFKTQQADHCSGKDKVAAKRIICFCAFDEITTNKTNLINSDDLIKKL